MRNIDFPPSLAQGEGFCKRGTQEKNICTRRGFAEDVERGEEGISRRLKVLFFTLIEIDAPMSNLSEPSSPGRKERPKEDNRPRFFDKIAKSKCWANAEVVPGRHPERWRKDAAGNIVCKRFANCNGCLCFEYDHIIPFSKGGESVVENCQILQTRVNRLKAAKDEVDTTQLKDYSCEVNFSDKELDIIEMAVYGDVIRPGKECRCRTVAEMLGKYKSKKDQYAAACKLP